jgi:hypothetical protein
MHPPPWVPGSGKARVVWWIVFAGPAAALTNWWLCIHVGSVSCALRVAEYWSRSCSNTGGGTRVHKVWWTCTV